MKRKTANESRNRTEGTPWLNLLVLPDIENVIIPYSLRWDFRFSD